MITFSPVVKANLKGIATILLWSAAALFISFTKEIPSFLLAALTSGCGFIMFSLRWVANREKLKAALIQPLYAWILFAVAVIGYRGFYLSGLKIAPPIEANLIHYLWPLLIVVLGAFVDKKMLSARMCVAALAGFSGILVLASANTTSSFAGGLNFGHLCALVGALSWAAYSVATRRLKITSNDLIGIMHLIAAVTFVILHVVTEQRVRWDKVDYMHWLGVVELGLAISLGYSWWDEAMNKGSPQQIAVLANFIPLLSTLWLVIFGGQLLTTQLAVAAMLIIGGSYLSVSAARRPN